MKKKKKKLVDTYIATSFTVSLTITFLLDSNNQLVFYIYWGKM